MKLRSNLRVCQPGSAVLAMSRRPISRGLKREKRCSSPGSARRRYTPSPPNRARRTSSPGLERQGDEAGVPLALYAHEGVLVPVLFGGRDFLLHLFQRSNRLVTDGYHEIARGERLCGGRGILRDFGGLA